MQFDKTDAYCLDGKRLVVVNKTVKTIEYRTIPDSQINVVEHEAGSAGSYFEVFLPNGDRILYGASESTRPMANNGHPLAWLAEKNGIHAGTQSRMTGVLRKTTAAMSQNMH